MTDRPSGPSNLRVVGGRDHARALARKAARPILRAWLVRVEELVRAGKLIWTDLTLAKELTNYPSANEGYCYAGRHRLGDKIGKRERAVRYSLNRLREAGMLVGKRRGQGRTSVWTFCVNGTPIFAVAERQSVATKPYIENNPVENSPPPDPHPAAASGELQQDLRGGVRRGAQDALTFDSFWAAIVQDHDPGPSGPALKAWSRLSEADRRTIFDDASDFGGRIFLQGTWAVTWLRERYFDRTGPFRFHNCADPYAYADLSECGHCAPQNVNAKSAFTFDVSNKTGRSVSSVHGLVIRSGTPEWRLYRDLRIARGERVDFFDTQSVWRLSDAELIELEGMP